MSENDTEYRKEIDKLKYFNSRNKAYQSTI